MSCDDGQFGGRIGVGAPGLDGGERIGIGLDHHDLAIRHAKVVQEIDLVGAGTIATFRVGFFLMSS